MKKLLLGLFLLFPLCGFAQKGMQGIGVNCGLGVNFKDDFTLNLNLNYQKHLSNRFRLSSSLGLYYVEEWYSYSYDYYGYGYYDGHYYYSFYCLITADAHYFFNQPRRLRPYALGGLFFGLGDGINSSVVGGVKLGLGLTYRLGYHWAMNLEAPLYLAVPAGSFLPTLGLTYTF